MNATATQAKKMTAAEMAKRLAELEQQNQELLKKVQAGGTRESRRQIVERPEWNFNVGIGPVIGLTLGKRDKEGKITGEDRTLKLEKDIPFVVFNADSGIPLRFTTGRYSLISNADLVERAEDAMRSVGFNPEKAEKSLITTPDGRKFSGRYIFKDKVTNLSKVGDKFGITLVIGNSYDGSQKATLSTEALRLACLNGNLIASSAYTLSRKHNSGKMEELDSELIKKAINVANGQFAKDLEIFNQLAEIDITIEQGSNVLARCVEPEIRGAVPIFGKRMARGIRSLWQNPSRRDEDKPHQNLYGLYNAATEFLTHEIAGKWKQYETAYRANKFLFDTFTGCIEDKKLLNSLIKTKAKVDLDVLRETASENEQTATE